MGDYGVNSAPIITVALVSGIIGGSGLMHAVHSDYLSPPFSDHYADDAVRFEQWDWGVRDFGNKSYQIITGEDGNTYRMRFSTEGKPMFELYDDSPRLVGGNDGAADLVE